MNINKIIFWILWIILLVWVIFFVSQLNSDSKRKQTNTQNTGDLRVWILYDDPKNYTEIIKAFKEAVPSYKNKNIVVESFNDLKSYESALSSAFFKGVGPDIFVIPSQSKSPFENMVLALDPSILSPNDFRLEYNPFFGSQMILNDKENKKEYVTGVPVGYETLGIYYNRRYFITPSSLSTWSGISTEVQKINEKNRNKIVPIALGNGTSVSRSPEILSSLLSLEGVDSLQSLDSSKSKAIIALYQAFGDINGENSYNTFLPNSYRTNDFDYFSQGDVAAIIGFPRDLVEIDKRGYQKNFLFAAPFPAYTQDEKNTNIYTRPYYINKNSNKVDFASYFLTYLASEPWQRAFLKAYPYYLPTRSDLFTEVQEKKILPDYNIVYKNFVSEGEKLQNFSVADAGEYDSRIRPILDSDIAPSERFINLKNYLVCLTTKHTSLSSLSSSCK